MCTPRVRAPAVPKMKPAYQPGRAPDMIPQAPTQAQFGGMAGPRFVASMLRASQRARSAVDRSRTAVIGGATNALVLGG